MQLKLNIIIQIIITIMQSSHQYYKKEPLIMWVLHQNPDCHLPQEL